MHEIQTFTVMTPLRPTFFMALEMIVPTSTSPLAEIVATYILKKHVKAKLQSSLNLML